MTVLMHELLLRVDEDRERHLALLFRLLQQPSVSAQKLGLQECAELVRQLAEQSHLKAEIHQLKDAAPFVYAERIVNREYPTILFYNHYDVQPVEPLEQWISRPFEPAIRDGKIYARGASDNKGSFAARLAALQVLKDEEMKFNVKFLIEGEEEIGSPHLAAFVKENRSILKADGCIWEHGHRDSQERPVLTLGTKGLLYVELKVDGPPVDAHSSLGTLIPNPAWTLVEALSSIRDPSGRIKIKGYYSDIRHSQTEVAMLRRTPFEESDLRKTLAPSGFVNKMHGLEAKKAHFLGTACNICGLYAGYTGEGSKTVLPSSATAKVDFRLVPDQDPRRVLRKLIAHLKEHSFSNVKVKVLSGYPAAHSSPNHWLVSHTAKTAKSVYGKSPVIYPSSPGSGPAYLVISELGIGTVATGVGYSDSRIHAPNENIRIEDFTLGIKHMVALLATRR